MKQKKKFSANLDVGVMLYREYLEPHNREGGIEVCIEPFSLIWITNPSEFELDTNIFFSAEADHLVEEFVITA